MQNELKLQPQLPLILLLLALAPSHLLHLSSAPPTHNSFSRALRLTQGQSLSASRLSTVVLFNLSPVFRSLETTIPSARQPSAPTEGSGSPSHLLSRHYSEARALLSLQVRLHRRTSRRELVSSCLDGPSSPD